MNHSDFFSAQTPEVIPAISEDYSDIIVTRSYFSTSPDTAFFEQIVDSQYSIFYAPLSEGFSTVAAVGYSGMPKLYTFQSTEALEVSGILSAQNQPALRLDGQDILVGFLDSGIDYTHPAFRNSDGTTRILGIWDQTDQSGPPPEGLFYGTEYTQQMLNEALRSPAPLSLVPVRDPEGHGTAAAGIACGSPDETADFTGAAPKSSILFVRLKPAKQYLREYFRIPEGAPAFQENDLMLGVRYLVDTAVRLRMPLVICTTMGTNQGGHTGATPLEEVLTAAQLTSGIYGVTGTGNEAGMGHHYLGQLSAVKESRDVEILVNSETEGFTLEFWTDSLELYSIGFISPLGETIPPVYPRPITSQRYEFLLENTEITLYYSVVEMLTGQQLAMIRFLNPSQGVWRVRITNEFFDNGIFHMWLPISGLVDPGIRFLAPDPFTTLTAPSSADLLLSASTYNSANNSIYLNSGRGYTRNDLIKPDFASPGVDLTAPAPGGRYTAFTGSSASAALTAGAAALLIQWGIQRFRFRYLSPREVKNLFIRGSRRSNILTYPNREWGYGAMDLYGIFQNLTRL